MTSRRLLVSACLLGQSVRYDGGDNAGKCRSLTSWLVLWQQQGRVIAVCPETLGGLPTPRPPAEIQNADGQAVLAGKAQVITRNGEDVSAAFISGANQTLLQAINSQATAALLAARSPSCGNQQIYNGSFSGTLRNGQGVTVALLQENGIRCFNPEQADDVIHWMEDSGE